MPVASLISLAKNPAHKTKIKRRAGRLFAMRHNRPYFFSRISNRPLTSRISKNARRAMARPTARKPKSLHIMNDYTLGQFTHFTLGSYAHPFGLGVGGFFLTRPDWHCPPRGCGIDSRGQSFGGPAQTKNKNC